MFQQHQQNHIFLQVQKTHPTLTERCVLLFLRSKQIGFPLEYENGQCLFDQYIHSLAKFSFQGRRTMQSWNLDLQFSFLFALYLLSQQRGNEGSNIGFPLCLNQIFQVQSRGMWGRDLSPFDYYWKQELLQVTTIEEENNSVFLLPPSTF